MGQRRKRSLVPFGGEGKGEGGHTTVVEPSGLDPSSVADYCGGRAVVVP